MSGEQLPLVPVNDTGAGDDFLRLLRQIVDAVGPKQVAYDLDVSPSLLSHRLAGRNGNYVPASWVPYLLRHDKTGEALRYLADLCGCDLVPQRALTPEEELAGIKEELARSLGPELLTGILTRAHRRARER